MVLAPSRELVLKKLRDCFPDPGTAREALAVLDTYGTEPSHRECHRVQLALLRSCAGDLGKLHLFARAAHSDYRDTLVPAEFYEESQASSTTSPQEMVAIRKRDRDSYEKWLQPGGT